MGLPEVRFYPGISYFICFSQTDGCHPDRFVQCLKQHDMDMDVSPIQVRLRSTLPMHTDDNGNSDIDRLTKELCNVLKDHDNVSIQNLVKYSFNYCYTRKLTESVYDWSDKEKNFVFGDRMQCEKIQDPQLTKAVRFVLITNRILGKGLAQLLLLYKKMACNSHTILWKIISHLYLFCLTRTV